MDDPILRQFLAQHDAQCPNCGYTLRGVSNPTCPECGTALRLELVGRRPPPMLTRLAWIAIALHASLILWVVASSWAPISMMWMALTGNGVGNWRLAWPRLVTLVLAFAPLALTAIWILARWRRRISPLWHEPSHFAVALVTVLVACWILGHIANYFLY